MAALVDIETAMRHLKLTVEEITPNPYQDDVQLKLTQATALVLMHIKRHEYADWSETTDPATEPEFAIVQAAILKVLSNLWRFRGDDDQQQNVQQGPLTPDVVLMLSGLRPPSIA